MSTTNKLNQIKMLARYHINNTKIDYKKAELELIKHNIDEDGYRSLCESSYNHLCDTLNKFAHSLFMEATNIIHDSKNHNVLLESYNQLTRSTWLIMENKHEIKTTVPESIPPKDDYKRQMIDFIKSISINVIESYDMIDCNLPQLHEYDSTTISHDVSSMNQAMKLTEYAVTEYTKIHDEVINDLTLLEKHLDKIHSVKSFNAFENVIDAIIDMHERQTNSTMDIINNISEVIHK